MRRLEWEDGMSRLILVVYLLRLYGIREENLHTSARTRVDKIEW